MKTTTLLIVLAALMVLGLSAADSSARSRSITLLGGAVHPIQKFESDELIRYGVGADAEAGPSFLVELDWAHVTRERFSTFFYVGTHRWTEPGYSVTQQAGGSPETIFTSEATVETRLIGFGKRFTQPVHERIAVGAMAGVEIGHWSMSAQKEQFNDSEGFRLVSSGSPQTRFGFGTVLGVQLQVRGSEGVYLVTRASWRFSLSTLGDDALWNLQDYQVGFRFDL